MNTNSLSRKVQLNALCLIGLAATLSLGALSAQGKPNVAAPFLQEGAGGRATGLGENYTAVAEGPFGFLFNPAGLATSPGLALGFQHETVAGGAQHEVLAGSFPLGAGGLAALFNYYNYGSIDRRDDFGQLLGEAITPTDYLLMLGYGVPLSSEWQIGANIGFYSENLGDTSFSGIVLDLGGKWDLDPDWSVAGVIKRLGSGPEGYSLPTTLNLAGAYYAFTRRLLLDLELEFPLAGTRLDLGLGAEFRAWEWFDLRLGFKAPLTDSESATLSGLVLGMGFNLGHFGLDISLMGRGDLGTDFGLALEYHFGQTRAPAFPKERATPKGSSGQDVGRVQVSEQEQAEYHYKAGKEYEKYGQVIDAIIEYKAALKIKPRYTAAQRALSAAKQKARKAAKQDRAQAKAGQPSASIQATIRKYYDKGKKAYRQKDYTLAIDQLKLVLELASQHREATALLDKAQGALNQEMKTLRRQAQRAKESGDLAAELEAYEKMLDLSPGSTKSETNIERLKKKIPEEVDRLYKKGVNLYARGQFRKALNAFETVLKLKPDHVKAQDAIRNTKDKLIRTGQ